ncbi:MAG: hypothetical protein WB615_15395 [Candidatus Tumulicola sp.]
MTDVEHKPVYGSKEKDEFICSCGWSGPVYEATVHYDGVTAEARATIAKFVLLVDDERVAEDWDALKRLEGAPGYLSPVEFVVTMRNSRLSPQDA